MSVIQNVELNSAKGKWAYRSVFALLLIGAAVQVIPFFWMIVSSFKTPNEIIRAIPSLLPEKLDFSGYAMAFQKYNIGQNIVNTAYIITMVILIQISTSTLAAYSLSKLNPRFDRAILMVILSTMMFSGTALMFPLYIVMADLPVIHKSLIGSKWAWILSSSAWAYSIVLFKNFFDGIPNDLFEAAYIDGAGKLKILVRIVLPLSKPVLAVNIVNTFMVMYNDFVFPMMLLPDAKDWTLMMRIFKLNQLDSVPANVIYALLTVATVPVILIYLFMQKYITEGISTSGLKG